MFTEMNLSPGVLRALEDKGFSKPTDVQYECIPLIMKGSDLVGRSKTGSGKTLAFGIPAIEMIKPEEKSVQVIVLCPTRELAMQVSDEIASAAVYNEVCKPVCVYGGANMGRQVEKLKEARIVVATPGRLKDHIRRKTISLSKVRMAVLDEADEMLNMGFREDIESILKSTPKNRQTIMFSATMPHTIKTITRMYMNEPEFVELGEDNRTIEAIGQSYLQTLVNGKKQALLDLYGTDKPRSSIVFCNTKRTTDEIYLMLNKNGIKAQALHGDMKQNERKRVMDAMKSGKADTLVATDVAARGIDIDDIDYVINYDLPDDLEQYIHRIGRTGRAGKDGNAVTIINSREQLNKIKYFKRETKSEIPEHPLSVPFPEIFNLRLTPIKRRR